jgi:hypothetical protein
MSVEKLNVGSVVVVESGDWTEEWLIPKGGLTFSKDNRGYARGMKHGWHFSRLRRTLNWDEEGYLREV